MKKSATWGFSKTGKPGLTWPTGSYAPVGCHFGKGYWVSLNCTSVVIYKEFPLDKGI